MPHNVTLSAAKGLSPWVWRCFAEFTLSEANVLSMTVLSCCRAITLLQRFTRSYSTLPSQPYVIPFSIQHCNDAGLGLLSVLPTPYSSLLIDIQPTLLRS
jgi:hypothetical protein